MRLTILKITILKFTLVIFLIFNSCNTTELPIIPPLPPVVKDTITVSVESFTHRSITLNVKSTANSKQSAIRVLRSFNNTTTTIAEYPIQTKDTTIIDDDNGTGLLLDTTYTYYAVRVDSLGQLKDTSNIVTQKTLAPTSHNYTWQEFTIGEWQSVLYDVWGTDENDVWAVGALTIGGNFYGALHWNGIEWVPDSTVGGSAIYGFSSNDIWVVGGGVFHFENNKWIQKDKRIVNGSVVVLDSVLFRNSPYASIWGTSSSNLYLGNQWGKIIHWDGSKASVLNSFDGTSITDISGDKDVGIYVTGSKNTTSGSNLVAFYNFENWQVISNPFVNATYPKSIKIFDANFVLLGGNNLFIKYTSDWEYILLNNTGSISKIRGNRSNNIFCVGFFKEAYHFNGLEWYLYTELKSSHGVFNSVFVTDSKVFIVGQDETYNFSQIYIGTK